MSKRHRRRQAARAAASPSPVPEGAASRRAVKAPPATIDFCGRGWFGLQFDLDPAWEDDIEALRRVPAPDDESGWVHLSGDGLLLLAARQTPRGWDYLVGNSAWEGRLRPGGVLADNLIHPDDRKDWIRAAKLLNGTSDFDRVDRAHGSSRVHLTWAKFHFPDEYLDLDEDDDEEETAARTR